MTVLLTTKQYGWDFNKLCKEVYVQVILGIHENWPPNSQRHFGKYHPTFIIIYKRAWEKIEIQKVSKTVGEIAIVRQSIKRY